MATHVGASGPRDPHFYIDQSSKRELLRLLREVPELAADLVDTRTRQTRFGAVDFRTRSGAREQRLPFNEAAARVEAHLHAVLVSWVRFVCEERGSNYAGGDTMGELSTWLERNINALALTDGSQGALEEIRNAFEAAAFVVCCLDTRRCRARAGEVVVRAAVGERPAKDAMPLGLDLSFAKTAHSAGTPTNTSPSIMGLLSSMLQTSDKG